jgi:hypothetical protein
MNQLYDMIRNLSDQVTQLNLRTPRPHTAPEVPPHRYQPVPPNPQQYQSVPPNPHQYQSVPHNPHQYHSVPHNTHQYQTTPTNHYQYQPRTQHWLQDQHRVAQETTYRRNMYDYVPQDSQPFYNEHARRQPSGPFAEPRWRPATSYQNRNFSSDRATYEDWMLESGFEYGPTSQAFRLANLRPDQSLVKFAGEADEDPYAWLRAFENVARARGWSSYSDKKAVLPSYLIGRAEKWWLHMEHRLEGWGDEPWSREIPEQHTFVGAFTRAFIPPAFANIWRKEFGQASQEPGEFPLDYHYRIADLVERLRMFEPVTEDQAIHALINGLIGDLQQEMIKRQAAQQIKTMDDAANHILELTTMYQAYGQTDKYYVPSNHYEISSDRKKMTSRYTLQAQAKHTTKKPLPTPPSRKKENDKSEVKTHKPKRSIPLDANGNPTTPCPGCGQPGHWKADCPRKEKQGFQSSRPN